MRGVRVHVALFPTVRKYSVSDLRADTVGGLTASAVTVPQAMAYATITGVPVQIGLYSCMVHAVVYAALGGSRTLNVSSTSTVATLSASGLVAASVASGSSDPVRDLVTLSLLVGVILLLAWIVRLGSIVENVSAVTLIGIRAGTGLTIAASQLVSVNSSSCSRKIRPEERNSSSFSLSPSGGSRVRQ